MQRERKNPRKYYSPTKKRTRNVSKHILSRENDSLPLQQTAQQTIELAHHSLHALALFGEQALHGRMLCGGSGVGGDVVFAVVDDCQHVFDVVGVEPGAEVGVVPFGLGLGRGLLGG